MNREQFAALRPGALVRHKTSSEAMIVTGHFGGHVVAVRTAHVSNPDEWDEVSPTGAVVVPPPRDGALARAMAVPHRKVGRT